ncbi:Bug family tripartite tricarboxylate transporter substrate binding protein [Pollutimonas bauzanensis]|uniref:Tripartite-type tricarboxylate transporter, receptor component TctC n=1 Tax=Pollutimonas bauzanensis TaxID=658167 RepID=A0A1M5Q7G0_9BURK|nr:tripartite tricarboxylate transporter substrate binding protein [Pollutimonas bauzanensis]SHH09958.1 Tripartite-type tricarboxylate transporter, receptor component TctC [Pollutimonas bauzanensis]
MPNAITRFLAAAALAATATLAAAAPWPEAPVRMIVPYPPGGATDFSARVYAEQLGKILGTSIVVENKAGAAGEIGAQSVASAAPDGYTVLLGALGSMAINSLLPSKQQQYKFPDAFEGVSMATSTPLAVVVRASLPVKNIQELIALAKERNGELSFASAGYGSSQHMTGEKFQLATGIKLLHVPYKGSGPALTDLIGGQVDMVFDTMPTLMGHVHNEKLRFLAVTTKERAKSLPDVPTLQEEGVKDFDVSTRYVLLAPKGTPEAIRAKLYEAMKQAALAPSVQKAMASQGADAVPSAPAETYEALSKEVAIWSDVVKNADLK